MPRRIKLRRDFGDAPPEPDCTCPVAGYCRRFGRIMAGRAYEICSGTSGLSEQHRAEYAESWRRLKAQQEREAQQDQ